MLSHDDESNTISFYITLRDSERASYETPQCAHTDVTVRELRHPPPAALHWYQARAGGSAGRMKLQLSQTINEGPLQLPTRHWREGGSPKNHTLAPTMLWGQKTQLGETSSTQSRSELWSELIVKNSKR